MENAGDMTVGRKAWLFLRSDDHVEAAALFSQRGRNGPVRHEDRASRWCQSPQNVNSAPPVV
jgi:hypothetical protein